MQSLSKLSEKELKMLIEGGETNFANNEELFKRLGYFMQLKQAGRSIPSPSQSSNSSSSQFH